MASPMDRVFQSMGNVAQRVMGGGPTVDPSVAANTTIPNGNTPVSNGTVVAIPPAGTGENSPLENYKDVFVNDPAKPAVGIPNPMPAFTLDQSKVKATAAGIDFTADISAEDLSVLYPGVPENAARAVLNKLGARGFETNFNIGTQSIEAAMNHQTKNFTEKTIPEVIRRQNISQLNAEQPLKINPATAPVFSMLEKQFADKYPNASAAEVAKHTQSYMEGMLGETAKATGKQVTSIPKAKEEMDWSGFDDEFGGAGTIFN